MKDDGKKYVVYGMKAKCSEGSMENYISTDVGHGVLYQGQPLLNANDHTPQVNLTHFGDCHSKKIYEEAKKQADEKYKADADDGFFEKAGKLLAKTVTKAAISMKENFCANKCELDTPLPWMFVNKEHMIDGAPALTVESQCACRYGGIITIVPEPEEEVTIETEEVALAENMAEPEDVEVKELEKEENKVRLSAGVASILENWGTETIEEQEIVQATQSDNEYIQMMKESYGFDQEQAELIGKAYNLFMNNEENQQLPREEMLHKLFSNMAGLCLNYSGGAIRWKLVCDTPSTIEAMKYFESLGLSEQETFDMMSAINFQHTEGSLLSKSSDYNSQGFCSDEKCNRECGYDYHITDSKYRGFDYGSGGGSKDFAHELIQYACFSNNSVFQNVWNAFEPILGNLDNLTSYKGDVYSTRMEKDDMNSDIDAINMYYEILNNGKDIFDTITKYNTGVSEGKINRAENFLKILGNGEADKGYEVLKSQLNQADWGVIYINSGIKGIIQDILYTNATMNSGVALQGEETFDEVMKYSAGKQTENNQLVNNKREEFLDYVYDVWKSK